MLYLLAAEGGHGEHISPLELFHPANAAAALWALGIFVVLLLVLRKVAWGPIVEGLNAREERIQESLEKAAAIEVATRELAETNAKTLEAARKEAQAIVAEAREAGKNAADDLLAKAREEIVAEKARFKREVQLETEKARAALREEAVDLTIAATSKLIQRSLDASDSRRLVEDALKDAESVARN